MQLKSILLCALAACLSLTAAAQTERDDNWNADYQPYPYAFVGLQGGVQTTFTDFDNTKLLMPTGAFSVGYMFTPTLGARLNVNGWRNKGAFADQEEGKHYYYNAITTDADLLVNLSNIIWRKHYHKTNLYLIGGLGLNYGWHNQDVRELVNTGQVQAPYAWSSRLFHNFRAGLQLEHAFTKHLAVNLEVTANNLDDRHNSKVSDYGDWQVNALVGLTYRFGFKKRAVRQMPVIEKPVVVEPVVEVVPEPTKEVEVFVEPEPVVVEEPVVEEPVVVRELQSTEEAIFFTIGSAKVKGDELAKVENLAQWLKDHPTATVTLDGYADVQTGNAQINQRLSEQRTAAIKRLLVEKYGISDARITSTTSHGDTVQPYRNNDSNRVVICKAKETE